MHGGKSFVYVIETITFVVALDSLIYAKSVPLPENGRQTDDNPLEQQMKLADINKKISRCYREKDAVYMPLPGGVFRATTGAGECFHGSNG